MALTRRVEDIIWSIAVFVPVGLASLGYVLFKRDFAKLHLDFSFLKFPVFVGEVLLFYCLVLLASYWAKNPPRFKQAYWLMIAYGLWFILKVTIGYHHWGPLAFRHAALFYYPFFCLIGFVFFNRDVFNQWIIIALFAVIIGIFAGGCFDRYWILTLASLGGILVLKIKNKPWAYALTAVLLVMIPYVFLFKTARMMFVANTVSLLLLLIGVVCLSRVRAQIKMAIAVIFFLLLSFAFYRSLIIGESGRVFVTPQKVVKEFKKMDADIQKKKPAFIIEQKNLKQHPEQHPVDLYNSEGYRSPDLGKEKAQGPVPLEWISTDNIIFRLLIWRDMLEDWKINKPVLGVDFGKPFLSISLEVSHWAEQEWSRDGWIEPHNSYFNMLYRAGIVGIILIILMGGTFCSFTKLAFERHSWTMILLAAIVLNWMIAANFLLILELPYTAIPFWSLAGMSLRYAHETKR